LWVWISIQTAPSGFTRYKLVNATLAGVATWFIT
jgi:hypothetical protein